MIVLFFCASFCGYEHVADNDVVIVLCGNKVDLKGERQVSFLEASRYAQENGLYLVSFSLSCFRRSILCSQFSKLRQAYLKLPIQLFLICSVSIFSVFFFLGVGGVGG